MLKALIPKRFTNAGILTRVHQEGRTLYDRIFSRTEEIDLRRTLLDGEGGLSAGKWAEHTQTMRRASLLLADSPHVKFLEKYRARGERVFYDKEFEETAYFTNAMDCVRICGHYFDYNTVEGIRARARSFISRYERIKSGNSLEVEFASRNGRLCFRRLPGVRKTWTPATVQIDDGMHRLAMAWVLGYKTTRALLLPAMPTRLQSLVATVATTDNWRELYQPINGVEFDSSWALIRRCDDRFEKMVKFLSSYGYRNCESSMLDLGCSYGWFVNEFSKKGYQHTVGVDIKPEALKIGRIAYGLRREQLVRSDLESFLTICTRSYDIVLMLSILHHLALKSGFGTVTRVLKQVDGLTRSVLFLDAGQAHEHRYNESLKEWDDDFVISLIKKNTSFDHVLPLGADSDNTGPHRFNYGRTLFACVRK